MQEDQKTIKFQVAYPNESKTRVNFLLLGVVVLIMLLIALVFMQFASRPPVTNFTLNDRFQIIDPIPLDQPGITKPVLLNWLNDLLSLALSFNYNNMDQQRSKVADYFSDSAMQSYLNFLANDEDLRSVKEMKFVVSVRPRAAPEILVQRAFRGRFAWQIRIPITIQFSNALVRSEQRAIVEFLVLRVPETESPMGIKVAGVNYRLEARTGRQAIRQGF